eukprot:TRINITY_DN41036_c0_g1_i1.p1 TRINITY_DN41036_c0_g1~~TRINITY_DN41036_c0_g1_i1.p1  ORF type:complete len:276 (-),score=67.21 TRINITY_DN41036_c0_g1_i1:81-908(-)
MMKTGVDTPVPDAPPPSWIDQITGAVERTIDSRMTMVIQRLSSLEDGQANIRKDVGDLQQRMSKIECNASSAAGSTRDSDNRASASWTPNRLEVKGWCTWNNRATHGFNRAKIMEVHQLLMSALDAEHRSKVGDPMIYNKINTSYFMPVQEDFLFEVLSTLKDFISSGKLTTESCEGVFIRAEISEGRKKKNAMLAKLLAFAQHSCPDCDVFPRWHPDNMIVCKKKTEGSTEWVFGELEVQDDPKAVFTKEALGALQLTNHNDLELAFKLFKPKR